MAVEKKDSVNEHIDRIKFVSKYQINEAKYSLVDGLEEDDTVPNDIWEEPQPVSPNDSNVMEDEEENPEMGMEEPAPEEEVPAEVPVEEPAPEMGMEEPMVDPVQEKSVNQLQNDMLRSSLSAMEKMNDQLKSLESNLGAVNSKLDDLGRDVEEVKEPTNVEKLMSKKEDSHPFKYNLNDMWDDNWFQARMEGGQQSEDENGIKQLEDGTFIADFDKLPKYSEQDIKDSF